MDYVDGIPALAGGDAVNDVPFYSTELRDFLIGTDWVAMTPGGGFSGNLDYRVDGNEVEIVGNLTGTVSLAPTIIDPIPAAIRPTGPTPRLGVAHFGAALVGAVDVNSSGRLRALNSHGTQSTCQFTIRYFI